MEAREKRGGRGGAGSLVSESDFCELYLHFLPTLDDIICTKDVIERVFIFKYSSLFFKDQ